MVAVAVAITCVTTTAQPEDDRPDSPTELQKTIETLVEKLDSNSRGDRVRAERELIRLGTQILPLLPPPEKLTTAAQRATVRRVRIHLERKQSRDSVLASTVTLSKPLDLKQTLNEITKQTGNKIVLQGEVPKKLNLVFEEESFWPAIDRLGMKSRLEAVYTEDATGLVLRPAVRDSVTSAIVSFSGPFRIQAGSGQVRPIFGDEDHRLLRIPITLMSEPRLRPLILNYSTTDITGRIGDTALRPLNPGAKYELSMGRAGTQIQRNLEFRIPIPLPSDKTSVRAKMMMLTAAGTAQFKFLDIADAKGVARRRGGVTVTIRKVSFRRTSKTQHAARIRVAVTYDVGGPAFESHQRWMLHNKTSLQTAVGKRIIQNSGFDISLELDGAVEVEYRFERLTNEPAEYQFVYEAPTLLINVPIEFELKDIPIEEKR